MPHTFETLTHMGARELHALWRDGAAPDPATIAGHVYRGRNTALLARLGPGGGVFAKGFFGGGDAWDGCNFPARARGGEWQIETAQPFGYFSVTQAAGARALLLDYGRGRAGAYRERGAPVPGALLRVVELSARPLRDLLVQPPDAAAGVLLGRAFFTGARVPLTYFVLERWQPLAAGWAAGAASAGQTSGRMT